MLKRLGRGRLTLSDGGETRTFGDDSTPGLSPRITVHDPRAYGAVLSRGVIGVAEAYIDGLWTTDDLVGVIRLFVRNQDALTQLNGHLAHITRPLQRIAHWLKRNTRAGSRQNIAAHYDLGNDFYALFLDATMMYSCAVFETPSDTLEQASHNKLERICRKLALSPSDHLLEIGTGWGGLAIHAAVHYGCKVTTTTISRAQAEYARDRIQREGLQDRIQVLQTDYRDLGGKFDKLVSVEMIEAVGHEFLGAYFRHCGDRLKPGGKMLLQAITMPAERYPRYLRSVDFIQKYIFPGCCVPSEEAMLDAVRAHTDLQLVDREDLTSHYALTLAHWRKRYLAQIDKVRQQGYSERFTRLWDFYLCYCEGGFTEKVIGDVHLLFTKP